MLLGDLRYWQLVLVAICVGTLTSFFNVAFRDPVIAAGAATIRPETGWHDGL